MHLVEAGSKILKTSSCLWKKNGSQEENIKIPLFPALRSCKCQKRCTVSNKEIDVSINIWGYWIVYNPFLWSQQQKKHLWHPAPPKGVMYSADHLLLSPSFLCNCHWQPRSWWHDTPARWSQQSLCSSSRHFRIDFLYRKPINRAR